MIIDNTRLVFGPERGYTTSIHDYFKNSDGYYVSFEKEFFDKRNERIIYIDKDVYLNGYDPDDVYIDCSFTCFSDYIENNTNISFTNDILIYNLRDLNSFVNSMYVTLFYNFIFRREFDYNLIMNSLLKIYDISSFLIRLRFSKKYKGKVYFVCSENFDINGILENFMIEPPKRNFPFLNDNLRLMDILVNNKLNQGDRYNIYQKHSYILFNMERYINEYRNEIDELNEKNIKTLRKCNFILGEFDEDRYRYNYNKNKVDECYVKRIVDRLPSCV